MKLNKGQLFKAFYRYKMKGSDYGYKKDEGMEIQIKLETVLFNFEKGTEERYKIYDEGDEMFYKLVFMSLSDIDLQDNSSTTHLPVYAIGLDKTGHLEYGPNCYIELV